MKQTSSSSTSTLANSTFGVCAASSWFAIHFCQQKKPTTTKRRPLTRQHPKLHACHPPSKLHTSRETWILGAIILQGPHHVAKKSTTTSFCTQQHPARVEWLNKQPRGAVAPSNTPFTHLEARRIDSLAKLGGGGKVVKGHDCCKTTQDEQKSVFNSHI